MNPKNKPIAVSVFKGRLANSLVKALTSVESDPITELIINLPASIKLDADTTVNFRAFLQGMANRRVVGALRYEDIPDRRKNYLTKLKTELRAYIKTGNSEYLFNVAVYAFLEATAPQHKNAHFDNTVDSATRKKDRESK